ncbi:MAG: peptidase S10 [Caulobacteraceae bacterium]|nr:peptidase S10 [Caulobacter sp.]
MIRLSAAAALTAFVATASLAAEPPLKAVTTRSEKPDATSTASPDRGLFFAPEAVESSGSVSVENRRIDYRAVAGTIIVHPKGWDDAAAREPSGLGGKPDREHPAGGDADAEKPNPQAEASMFYVAYFAKGAPAADRPITFLYNGGPGSSSVWLHMGAFGPRRVVTADDTHTPAAPYRLVNNDYSLLDASDLVFIDAPGTGFSRIAGKDKEKSFYGVDPDGYAFTQFIMGFLSRYGRWNSPKYLFGESYGTPRSAIVANNLTTGNDTDLNGVILLSQILNFDLSADGPQFNPGTDQAYIVALPTYAATAWYHNRLQGGRPADLKAYLAEVQRFATGEYAQALQAGSELDAATRQRVAERFARYTGLPVAYVLKADLRVNGGMFEKMLQDAYGVTTGRLDTRFSGPDIDPLSKEADYDPQSAAISSAYVSTFNTYVRDTLHFGAGRIFKPETDVGKDWNFQHQPPGASYPVPGATNVMPDLAQAMKYNPGLKVMVNGGYYDLATPYYEGWYEMHHMPIAPALQANIEYKYYDSGHMVYAHEPSLKQLHDSVAAFIQRTDNLSSGKSH